MFPLLLWKLFADWIKLPGCEFTGLLEFVSVVVVVGEQFNTSSLLSVSLPSHSLAFLTLPPSHFLLAVLSLLTRPHPSSPLLPVVCVCVGKIKLLWQSCVYKYAGRETGQATLNRNRIQIAFLSLLGPGREKMCLRLLLLRLWRIKLRTEFGLPVSIHSILFFSFSLSLSSHFLSSLSPYSFSSLSAPHSTVSFSPAGDFSGCFLGNHICFPLHTFYLPTFSHVFLTCAPLCSAPAPIVSFPQPFPFFFPSLPFYVSKQAGGVAHFLSQIPSIHPVFLLGRSCHDLQCLSAPPCSRRDIGKLECR